jgi:hypothetical protein
VSMCLFVLGVVRTNTELQETKLLFIFNCLSRLRELHAVLKVLSRSSCKLIS